MSGARRSRFRIWVTRGARHAREHGQLALGAHDALGEQALEVVGQRQEAGHARHLAEGLEPGALLEHEGMSAARCVHLACSRHEGHRPPGIIRYGRGQSHRCTASPPTLPQGHTQPWPIHSTNAPRCPLEEGSGALQGRGRCPPPTARAQRASTSCRRSLASSSASSTRWMRALLGAPGTTPSSSPKAAAGPPTLPSAS